MMQITTSFMQYLSANNNNNDNDKMMINKNNMLMGLIIISIFYTTCSATCISCSIESFKYYNNKDVDSEKSLHSSIILKSLLLHKQKNRIQSLTKIKGGHISSNSLHDDIINHSSSHFNLSLSAIKILLQLILTGFNVLCWCIPLRYKNFTQNNDILSLANSFSGGIFLMLCYGHLLPESISLLLSASDSSSDSGSSSISNKVITKALLYCLFGYMLMLFIEKVAFNASHHNHDDNNDCEISYKNNDKYTSNYNASKINRSSSITSTSDSRNKNDNHNSNSSVKSAIALCSALSIHSFFEAMALGISTDITSATMMTTCISLHQPAESIALLVAFLKSGINHQKIYIYLTLYSLVALVGVITGVLVNKMASSSIEGIIMAITAGTFIYVGATEIASEEFETNDSTEKAKRFLCYCSGIGIMAAISAFSERFESS